jgi:exodeoxyribonuclease VII large subunit
MLGEALRGAMEGRVEALMQRVDILGHRLVHPAQRLAASRQRLDHLASRLAAAMRHDLQRRAALVQALRLRHARRRTDLGPRRQRLQDLHSRLARAAGEALLRRQARLSQLQVALAALNPQATLARGFAIVRDDSGAVVRDASRLSPEQALRLQFERGAAAALVTRTFPD